MATYIHSPSYAQYLPKTTSSSLPGVRDLFPGMYTSSHHHVLLCGVCHANAVTDLWALPLYPHGEATDEPFTPLHVPSTSSHGPVIPRLITQQSASFHLPSYFPPPPPPLPTPDPSPPTRTNLLPDDTDAVTYQSQPQPQRQPLPVSFLCSIKALPSLSLSLPSLHERRNRVRSDVQRRSARHPAGQILDSSFGYGHDSDAEVCRKSNVPVANTGTSNASRIASTTVVTPVFYRCALRKTIHGHALQHELQHGHRLGDTNVEVVPQQRNPSEPLACRRCLKRFEVESQLDSHYRTHPAHVHMH
jgi:hypothetical protein